MNNVNNLNNASWSNVKTFTSKSYRICFLSTTFSPAAIAATTTETSKTAGTGAGLGLDSVASHKMTQTFMDYNHRPDVIKCTLFAEHTTIIKRSSSTLRLLMLTIQASTMIRSEYDERYYFRNSGKNFVTNILYLEVCQCQFTKNQDTVYIMRGTKIAYDLLDAGTGNSMKREVREPVMNAKSQHVNVGKYF